MSIREPNGEGEAFLPRSREGEVVADGKVRWVLGNCNVFNFILPNTFCV